MFFAVRRFPDHHNASNCLRVVLERSAAVVEMLSHYVNDPHLT